MLIYNYQKEFLGMDEKDLKTLGFQDLASLRTEVTDFADLFVKTPGYIHNFKHVHWIDFITCAESNEESKVIINVNNKNFKCTVQIASAFLVDNPSSKAYLIALHNLRELTHKESESIAGDIIERQAPQVAAPVKPIFNTPEFNGEFEEKELETPVNTEQTAITVDPYETPIEIDLHEPTEMLSVDAYDDTPQKNDMSLDINITDEFEETPLEIEDDFSTPLDIDLEDDIEIQETSNQEPKHTTTLVTENFDNGYQYDPSVASDELGLPLDLIEEFIQDFIEQAKEFKDDLYQALEENDLDKLKILSHKLKGVAANLRIEDALEALTIVNTSSDSNVIRENMDTLYKIIAKLAGEEISVEKEVEISTPLVIETPQMEIEEDLLSLDFKDEEEIEFQEEEEEDLYIDPIEVDDSQVPQKIEIPELADDTFIQEEEIKIDLNLDSDFEDELILDIEPEVQEEVQEIKYSKEIAANEIGLDKESFHELFNDYLEEAKASTVLIKDALINSDFNTCKSEAIKFKGMSDNMRINSFASELETLIHSTDEVEIAKAVDKIETAVVQLSNIED